MKSADCVSRLFLLTCQTSTMFQEGDVEELGYGPEKVIKVDESYAGMHSGRSTPDPPSSSAITAIEVSNELQRN
jgi:hypothetical protein